MTGATKCPAYGTAVALEGATGGKISRLRFLGEQGGNQLETPNDGTESQNPTAGAVQCEPLPEHSAAA